jgi:hypothetical protein
MSKVVYRTNTQTYTKGERKMIKLTKNQLMILDAMMNQGGTTKKYEDSKHKLRYSEHIGMLDFDDNGLEKIIVSTKRSLEADNDPTILLPDNPPDALDYEYIFHTHPPTPYPGARAKDYVLYEFPSVDDLYHFSYHYNEGRTQGSIIIAPEGLYLIVANKKKIDVPNFKTTYKKQVTAIVDVQVDAIAKYGDSFEGRPDRFYSKVAQDTAYLKRYNSVVTKYWGNQLKVLYKPRKRDAEGNWFIPSIYIPVEVIEPF